MFYSIGCISVILSRKKRKIDLRNKMQQQNNTVIELILELLFKLKGIEKQKDSINEIV